MIVGLVLGKKRCSRSSEIVNRLTEGENRLSELDQNAFSEVDDIACDMFIITFN